MNIRSESPSGKPKLAPGLDLPHSTPTPTSSLSQATLADLRLRRAARRRAVDVSRSIIRKTVARKIAARRVARQLVAEARADAVVCPRPVQVGAAGRTLRADQLAVEVAA